MRFNFVEYLKDAKFGIERTAQRTTKWMHNYDTLSTNSLSTNLNSNSQQNVELVEQSSSENNNTTAAATVNSKQASPKKSPQHSILAESMTANNQYNMSSFHELDYDPDEFLFNLKINSTSLEDPNIRSARSTVNIFAKDEEENDDDDDDDDDDELSILSERHEPKNSNSKSKHHHHKGTSSSSSSSTKPVRSSEKKTDSSAPKRRAKNPRNRSNDFYVLSFDNELSETESTTTTDEHSSSSSLSLSKSANNDHIEDNDSTNAASLTSNTTINQDSSSGTPPPASTAGKDRKKSVSSLESTDRFMTSQNRDRLVEYLFLDEENHHMYMETGLTEFLTGLDRFFRELNIKTSRMKPKELGGLLDQIVDMYDEVLSPKRRLPAVEAAVEKVEAKEEEEANSDESKPVISNENEVVVDAVKSSAETTCTTTTNSTSNLTTFPVYNGNDSFNSSTDSIATNSQAVDSGIESTKDFAGRHQATMSSSSSAGSSESDIGPFLSAILGRLDGMLGNSLEVNLLVTGLIGRLAYYHQNMIRSFLLDGDLALHPNVKSLIQVRYFSLIYTFRGAVSN
jgi:hypothetical protein